MKVRAIRLAERMGVSIRTARRAARDLDRRRAQFDRTMHRANSNDPHNFDMVLDTNSLGLTIATEIIVRAIEVGRPAEATTSSILRTHPDRGILKPEPPVPTADPRILPREPTTPCSHSPLQPLQLPSARLFRGKRPARPMIAVRIESIVKLDSAAWLVRGWVTHFFFKDPPVEDLDTQPVDILPEYITELEEAVNRLLRGTRDPEAMRKACERMDRMREEMRQRHVGEVEFAVDLIRESRDEA